MPPPKGARHCEDRKRPQSLDTRAPDWQDTPMRMSTLILTLFLTLALFPWGAYATVMGADAQRQPATTQSASLPPAESAPVAQSASLCHGPALNGSACHPLSALLPGDTELPDHLRQSTRGEAAAFWPEGPAPLPLLTPPRLC